MSNKGIESILNREFTPKQLKSYIARYKNHIGYVRIVGRESIDSAKEKYKKLKNKDYKNLIPSFLNENESIEINYNSKIKKSILLEYRNGKYYIENQ